MAQSIGTVLIDIKADTQQLIQGFNKAEQRVNSAVSTMKSSITALTTAYLAFEGTISASKIVDISAQIEKQKAILKTLEGNGDSAKKSFEWIKDFAKSTPFELQQVTAAFIKAKSYGIDPTTGSLKTLGDTASAMGKDINQAIEALADAMVGENERLKEFGIKATATGNKISYSWTDSSGQTKKTVVENNKEIIKSTIEAIFNSKYQGAMKDQMNTWYGMVSNMKDNYTNFIDAVMQDSGAFDGLKNIVKEIGDIGSSLNDLSPEQIASATDYIKNMGLAVAGSYVAIKSAQTAYSTYNSILESNAKVNKLNIDIEQAKAKALHLSERATIARTIADEAYNTKKVFGNSLNKTQIQDLQKQAVLLESQTRKQNSYVTLLEATAKGFSASAIGANLLKTAFSTIPFMVIATGISAIATSLLQASDSSEILEKTLKSTGGELSKLTVNQLNYRKDLIATELIQTRLELSNAKAKATNGTLKDKSYADEMSIKFEELTKASRNVKEALSNVGKEVDNLNSKKKDSDSIVRDDSAIIKLMGTEYEKLTLEIEENSKKLKESGATQAEIDKYKANSIKDFNEKQQKETKKTQDELDKTNKALLDISQIGMSEYDKGLVSITEKTNEWAKAGVSEVDILNAKNKLLDELKSKTLYEAQKEDLSYYEQKIQLMDDSISKELELQGIAYTNKILEIENSTKSIAEKDKLIAKETELFNLTVQSMNYKYNTEFQDTMSNFYDDMLDSQLALNNAVYDFGSGFDGVSSKIGAVSKSIAAMSSLELTNKKEASKLDKKYIEQFNKYAGDVEKTKELEKQYTKDTAILNEQNIQAQLAGYANIAGAMSGMFEQGSREAASFQLVESSLALATGIRAILTQGSGDPYTAFARMAAMTATVSSMLGNIGIAFDMNKTSTSSDAFSAMTANNGSGSVLGDSEASTKSITNALSTLEDFAKPEYQTLLSMNNYLETIATNIGGVTSLLIQSGGFAFGDGYTGFDTGYKNNIGLNTDLAAIGGGAGILAGAGALGGFGAMGGLSVLGPAALGVMALDKLLLGGALTNVVGGVVNTVLGGVFGKTSVSQSLTDSGIYFADTLLTSAIDQFNGEAYQTISTTVSKKSWFSKSSSTSIATYFDELDSQTERQFSLVLDNLYNTVLVAGTALDSASIDTEKSLENFVVSIGKISLKDKTGDEIQETLTSVFGEIGDNITKTAFPLLTPFQQVGEGMFETLTRVATGMEEAEYYIGRLGNKFADVIYTSIGNKQGDVGFEALIQSIEKVEKSTYPLNNNLLDIVDNLDATAEELYKTYIALDELRDRLIFIGQSAAGISSSMIYGAGSADALSEGFNSFFENFLSENEQLTYKTQQLIENFNNLGIALPVSKDSFKALLSGLDLTSSAGQELYGRLIILSESFAEVADSTSSSIEDLTTSLTELSTNSFDTFISSLDSVGQSITSIKQTALGFINGFTNSSSASLKEQLVSYNKLRGQFADYFDSNGIIKAGVNKDTVSGLYSQITSLASNISGKDSYLKDSLISQISSDLVKFNSAEDILKVNIVDGLGSLLGLNNQQLTQLQAVASDGKITNTELSTINGLTKTQKDGILEFASNSSYFSTEDTLSSLNEYMKKQLEVLQQNQSNETAKLSSQTLTYGDYIGKQEQIDIATKLGVSYSTAQPLVEQVQALSISKNKTADIKSILGFKDGATDYNKTLESQLYSLAPYLNNPNEIYQILGSIQSETLNNNNKKIAQEKFEAEKADFNARYSAAISNVGNNIGYKYVHNLYPDIGSDWWYSAQFGGMDTESEALAAANYHYNGSGQYAGYGIGEGRISPDKYKEQLLNLALAPLLQEKALKGFAIGGYTGDIPANAIAGFVHGKEHILDSNVTSQINQIGSVTDMVNQYMNQNLYEKMNQTFIDMKNEIRNLVKITIAQANQIKKLTKETEFGGKV